MGNCETWGTVDFGRGPVDIRCTQTGAHAQCRTEVFINPDGSSVLVPRPEPLPVGARSRVFDED